MLTAWSGPGLVAIGILGLLIGWVYSAPPLKLNSHGLGELCVATGFLLIVVGTDYVQRKSLDVTPLAAGLPYAVLVTALLFINPVPRPQGRHRCREVALGRSSGASVGTLGICAARRSIGWSAYYFCDPGVAPRDGAGWVSRPLPGGFAAREVLRYANTPSRLAPAIKATIAAALANGIALAVALVLSR